MNAEVGNYNMFLHFSSISGILLVVVMSIIYVFALPCFMRRAYHAFRLTHLFNVAFYALTMLHGLPKLLDVSTVCYIMIASKGSVMIIY